MNSRRSERVSSSRWAYSGNPSVVLWATLICALLCLGLAIYSHWSVRRSFAEAAADFNTRFEKMKSDFDSVSSGTLPGLDRRLKSMEVDLPKLASVSLLDERAKPLEAAIGALRTGLGTQASKLTTTETRVADLSASLAASDEKIVSLEETQNDVHQRLVALNQLVPVGTVLPFSQSVANLPPEWAPCDGRSPNAPDLRARFLRGTSSSDSLGSAGGVDSIEGHRHEVRGSSNDVSFPLKSLSESLDTYHVVMRAEEFHPYLYTLTADGKGGSHGHEGGTASFTGRTDARGAHDNRPRYTSVHYICRIR